MFSAYFSAPVAMRAMLAQELGKARQPRDGRLAWQQ